MKGLRIVALALLALVLQGCVVARETLNEPLWPDTLNELEAGRSTAIDVVARLGAPTEVVQLGLRSAYRYDYTVAKRTGLILIVAVFFERQTRSDRIWLFFDENGVLTHYGVTLESDTARHAMPWQER